jgi:hypothetical protein
VWDNLWDKFPRNLFKPLILICYFRFNLLALQFMRVACRKVFTGIR